MSDLPRNTIVTPEAVSLDLDTAGLGSRGIAQILDTVIQVGLLLAFVLIVAGFGLEGAAQAAVLLLASLVVFWGYYFVFEGLWNGQTPGKRAQRIRVVRVDGQPVGWTEVIVRNLLRIVDLLPAYYMVGAVSIIVTRNSQRLGDLAAGTIVVHERKAAAPAPFVVAPLPPVAVDGSTPELPFDASAVSEAHYDVARAFLQRRFELDPEARRTLAANVANSLRRSLAVAPGYRPDQDERFLESVAAAYQARFRPNA
jgi:uncharacterized RDD family membrane protein YckC